MLSLDAEKAFDRFNWKFLYQLSDKFGLKPVFSKSIKALHNKPKAEIKINGAVSNSFILERGKSQDCPLSPLLFAIFIESLSQGINPNNNITCIKVLDQEFKISLFVDNVWITLSNPENSILELLPFLDSFGIVSS